MKIKIAVGVAADTKRFERTVALAGDKPDPEAIARAIDQLKARILADIAK